MDYFISGVFLKVLASIYEHFDSETYTPKER